MRTTNEHPIRIVSCQRMTVPFSRLMVGLLVLASAAMAFGQQEKVVYPFTGGGSVGSSGLTGLIPDTAGNFYGATYTGGTSGSAFELSPTPGNHVSETTLHQFGGAGDGMGEVSVMTFDRLGNLYGATAWGGASGLGTVFQLVRPASPGGTWTENVLHNFAGNSDGAYPYGGVVFDKAGNLFGTTVGQIDSGTYGTVYELSPPAEQGGSWTEAILYSFSGTNDGCGANGKLVIGANGALYGAATQCGNTQNICFDGCGTIFELIPPAQPGEKWTEHTIYRFKGGDDGGWPANGVVRDHAGNLYGATQQGGNCSSGSPGCGTVFELSHSTSSGGKEEWTETVLYSFAGGIDGEQPEGGVIVDQTGNLFGTTSFGGDLSCNTGSGCGTVFELSPPMSKGGIWTEATLHSFSGVPDGATSISGLAFSAVNTAVYGTTTSGGKCESNPFGCGTVFEVLP